MPSYTPVLIDSVDAGAASEKQPAIGGVGIGGINVTDKVGPFAVGANLYIVMGTAVFNGTVNVWKSTNNGATWNRMNQAGSPANRNWCAFFNKATGKIIVAYMVNANPGAIESVNLIQFDTSTDTWGPLPSAPPASTGQIHATFSCVQRSNGDVIIFGIDDTPSPASYKYLIWNGAAWSITGFDVQGNAQSQSCSACIDSSDRTHFIISTGSGVSYNINYYNLSSTNVLSAAVNFLWTSASGMFQNYAPRIDVSDSADTIYIANCRNGAGGVIEIRIFFATPRSAPVWNGTFQGTLIGQLPAGVLGVTIPYLTVGNDGNLHIAILGSLGGNTNIYYATAPISNNPISGWTTQIVFDFTLSTVVLTAFPSEAKIFTASPPKVVFNAATGATGITRFVLGIAFPNLGHGIFNPLQALPKKLPWPNCPIGNCIQKDFKGVM